MSERADASARRRCALVWCLIAALVFGVGQLTLFRDPSACLFGRGAR